MATTPAELRKNFHRLERFGWFVPDLPQRRYPYRGETAQAAVIFLIGLCHGEPHVLITKRSNNVGSHTGEACLPGGMRENADASLVETALREAEEEVGLDRGLTELLAVLPPFPSHRGTTTIAVTPVACLLRASPEELRLHPNTEVECLFWVPLELFVSNRNRNDHRICMEGMDFDYPCFDYVCSNGDTHTIWGLTAAICTVLASVALDRSHDNPTTMFLICSTKGATITLTEIATTSKVVQQYGGSQLTSKL